MILSPAIALPAFSGLPQGSMGDMRDEIRRLLGLLGWSQMAFWPWLGTERGAPMNERLSIGSPRNGGPNPPEMSPSPDADGLPFYHEPVLLRQVVEYLRPTLGSWFFDATLGGGGHTEALLQAGANVVAMDQDPVAIAHATSRLRAYAGRFSVLRGNFRHFEEVLGEIGIRQFDGILADIGVSSKQLDDVSKGFSFMHDGPLDLRMDPDGPQTAADLVNTLSEEDLMRMFFDYGEEPKSRRIARGIVQARAVKSIRTTLELAQIVEKASPRTGKRHPATLVFQALRIAVNDELGALQDFLKVAPKWLKPGGRLAIISFHSLEDRIVKHTFQKYATAELDRPEWPAPRPNPDFCLRLLTRKPLEATPEELQANPRARSARLRVAERITLPQ
ncbi:MAG: Ribosomal small subunit methyltransferase [Verrucomicrobiaceae bacterium]|nr:Ribosomal small subunit methyltransferase [Verrucomicrobiaceae bacterium]